jgi:hypothetical protein
MALLGDTEAGHWTSVKGSLSPILARVKVLVYRSTTMTIQHGELCPTLAGSSGKAEAIGSPVRSPTTR